MYNNIDKLIMKFLSIAVLALTAVAAVNLDQKTVMSLAEPCEPALDVSEK